MGLTTAERNRRKRERKKKERAEERKKQAEEQEKADTNKNEQQQQQAKLDVEIEYIAEPVLPEAANNEALEAVRRFQERAVAAVISDTDEQKDASRIKGDSTDQHYGSDDDEEAEQLSKRKLREMLRPTVAELKRRVQRPDLVEAHDVTAPDPEFLIRLKGVRGSVPVPRHWGRKRKYLQGKRGFEKPPFQLPEFLVATGITELRDSVAAAENEQSAKQKNRARVTPKLGAIDVDYRKLHDAFFKHQTKPNNMTKFGDLYYEGKELEQVSPTKMQPGQPLSAELRLALGMNTENAPPPWLINMQRYGPPPSYPSLKIPGLNAPLPSPECQYGYHPGGYGKPPVDTYGRPLYGGNPFAPPGSSSSTSRQDGSLEAAGGLVTSDGKTVTKMDWGALPTADMEGQDEEEEEEESSSEEEMEESSEEEAEQFEEDGMESTLPPPSLPTQTAPVDLRKTGTETPMSVAGGAAPQQLYQVIDQKQASAQGSAVFASEVAYVVPSAAPTPEGAESVLSKAMPAEESAKRKRKDDDDDDNDLGKNFKF